MALRQMALSVRREALVMSFADVFLLLTALFAALAVFGLLMKKPAAEAAAPAH